MAAGPDDPLDELAALWAWFGESIVGAGAPIYEDICTSVAGDRQVLALVYEAPPTGHFPLTLLAAVHFLLLGGLDHPLAAVYEGASRAEPWPLFRDLCLTHREAVLDLLATRHIQTNEVGRSALIGPALSWVAERFGQPVQLLDVGCSAGLNLLCDSYLLDYGDHGTTGPADAAVRIDCAVVAGTPPIRPRLPAVSRRIGVDIDPPDLRRPDDVRWLLACVWPGSDRLPRAERAIRAAVAHPPAVVHGDALAVVPDVLDGMGPEVVCLLTTWAFSYLHPPDRTRFVELLAAAAARRPLVWIACDAPGVVDLVDAGNPPDLGLGEPGVMSAVTFGPTERRAEVLAFVQSHGAWLDWRA
jgi:hypothetical protein